ncbi:3-oxoacyl-[acyl-carrier-protein] reductase [Amphibacillus sp. MSJ-3]|uniref:3-oxoacyl-[acyl-carrier-protein] reductase n=1 Tax=Amphibacillus sp. MSJ-3 TaxID=2841505 RepID=UPI001C0E9033|nr:3-oxoacyl-[acyl-carrier-protein] reductase [Amphibacillus sp. MSJ-3]MBU5594593.1 3-oxoacyl-[acyl-carrier-protein] reductase [Amphibacillus sp. MSJ-3]
MIHHFKLLSIGIKEANKLTSKVALVTGASRGIGRAIALELANKGYMIAINYSGNQAKAEEVAEEIKKRGQQAIVIKADVSNETEVKEMVSKVIKEWGSLDVLVNNAGITKDNLLMRMKEEEFDQVIDTNLKGVFFCMKAVSRQMMKQRSGKIINISSVVGLTGNPGQINYVAAKSAVIGMTKTAAKELASRNILVNAVAPGFIETEMTDQLDESLKEEMFKLIPLERLGQVEDVAKAVAFLASDDANYITGQTLSVNGGMVM